MLLTQEEEKGLSGEYGEALATAYRILISIGEATNAEKLVPIEWAHVSGVNYNTIGDSGLEFLKKISMDGRVRVTTSLNPMGFDRDNQPDLSVEFIKKQGEIAQAYNKMGITPTFSCIPYEIMALPGEGTQVSLAESSAAVLANSHLNLKTNKESALSALASAITGKSPYSELRIEENRNPQIEIINERELDNELDYGLLGYFTGKTIQKSCTGICNVSDKSEMWNLKSLAAGIGTSGSCGMFRIHKKSDRSIEKINYGETEMKEIRDELNTAEDGQVITFGSPQLGMEELCKIQTMLQNRKFTRPCKVFCPKMVYCKAKKTGLIESLQRSGVSFISDACTCLTPLITRKNYDSIITNSVKASYYMKTSNKISVALMSLKSIIRKYTT
ncbi:aconitase X [Candidatus Nitrosocosmicus hydrocola]|jgi:predicted aconitase|uniref:aconitase X n=1 Tax=Candidatus Nitrosocosmicus hydrocola TaxID=1826872 RepID=UPI000A732B52|nr:aconitase X catalytic domain-containing protein [Candidatus Nitrosocosmicus hydrocola]